MCNEDIDHHKMLRHFCLLVLIFLYKSTRYLIDQMTSSMLKLMCINSKKELWSSLLERINKINFNLQKNAITLNVATKLFVSVTDFTVRSNFLNTTNLPTERHLQT